MWPETYSLKAVHLVKKSITVTEIINFSKGIVFLLAHPVYNLNRLYGARER